MRNRKMSNLMVSLTALVIITVVFAGGCEKQASPPSSANSVSQSPPAAAEQTECPVMGGPVNKNIFTEYQGKKVYFCCEQCKASFKANPEKYLAKLPQFAK